MDHRSVEKSDVKKAKKKAMSISSDDGDGDGDGDVRDTEHLFSEA
jgi:hypothetical protein